MQWQSQKCKAQIFFGPGGGDVLSRCKLGLEVKPFLQHNSNYGGEVWGALPPLSIWWLCQCSYALTLNTSCRSSSILSTNPTQILQAPHVQMHWFPWNSKKFFKIFSWQEIEVMKTQMTYLKTLHNFLTSKLRQEQFLTNS